MPHTFGPHNTEEGEKSMRRMMSFVYGSVVYVVFLGVFLYAIGFVGNMFVARYLKDAKTHVKMHSTSGEFVREVTACMIPIDHPPAVLPESFHAPRIVV